MLTVGAWYAVLSLLRNKEQTMEQVLPTDTDIQVMRKYFGIPKETLMREMKELSAEERTQLANEVRAFLNIVAEKPVETK